MYHTEADEFLRQIYDHCSDPVSLCEESHAALDAIKLPKGDSIQLYNVGSIQAIYRRLPEDLRKTVFTPMKIRSLLASAFNYKTRSNFTDHISDLGLKQRAELAKGRPPGEHIPTADYRLNDDKYVKEFIEFLERTVHRRGS